jgi:predicted amidohydrolase YtcJ
MKSRLTMAIGRRLAAYVLFAVFAVRMSPAVSAEGAASPASEITGTKRTRSADLVLRNGVVYTVNERQPLAQAVAVNDGKLVFVGANDQVAAFTGPRTRVVDLQGTMVLPGIFDSHIHTAKGEFYNRRLCDVRSFTNEEGYSKLARCAATAPAGDWVVAFGWYSTDNPKLEDVTLARLDAIVPTRKLAVISLDNHTVWVNTKLMQEFSIARDTPDPPGGRILRDPQTQEPTGVLQDAAGFRIENAIRTASTYAATARELHRSAIPYLNSIGITSLLDASVDDDLEAGYRELDSLGSLPMRVSLAFKVFPDNYRTLIPIIATKRKVRSDHIRVDFIKVFADGNLEDNLANMLGEGGEAGHGYYTQEQMNEIVRLAEKYGLSVYVHSIGDGATRQVLDAVAAARKVAPCPRCRHTLTHLQWVSPSDIPRFRQLHVIANIQEGWLAPRSVGGPPGYDYVQATADGPIGPKLALRMYPFRQLRDAGAQLSAGSDWFFTDENPWNDIEAGTTSRDPGVVDQKPMLPASALDLKTLVRARTIGAAYQMFNEKITGSIEVGKQADLVVINQNIFAVPIERVHNTKVLMTFLAGRQLGGH